MYHCDERKPTFSYIFCNCSDCLLPNVIRIIGECAFKEICNNINPVCFHKTPLSLYSPHLMGARTTLTQRAGGAIVLQSREEQSDIQTCRLGDFDTTALNSTPCIKPTDITNILYLHRRRSIRVRHPLGPKKTKGSSDLGPSCWDI